MAADTRIPNIWTTDDTQAASACKCAGYRATAWRLGLGSLAAMSVLGLLIGMRAVDWTFVLGWMQAHPGQVLPGFILAMSASIVALLPGALFCILGGALYGTWLGGLVAWIGTVVGQTCAFLLGRGLFRNSLSLWVHKKFPSWHVVERALFQQGGIKMVLLLRLSPILPDSVMNYALSITNMTFRVFTVASAISLMPYAFFYASVGAASSDIAKTLSGGGDASDGGDPRVRIAMICVSGVMFAVMLWYVGTTLKQALADAEAERGGAPLTPQSAPRGIDSAQDGGCGSANDGGHEADAEDGAGERTALLHTEGHRHRSHMS